MKLGSNIAEISQMNTFVFLFRNSSYFPNYERSKLRFLLWSRKFQIFQSCHSSAFMGQSARNFPHL